MRVVSRLSIAVIIGALASLPAISVSAPTAGAEEDALTEAKNKVAEARAAADEVAKQLTEAQSRYEVLGDQIVALQDQIAAGNAEADELRLMAQRRALNAYKGTGDAVVAFTEDDPQDAGRRTEYLEQVNARDNAAVAALAALNEDLEAQTSELSAARSEQESALASLDEQRKAMETALAEATAAQQALEERLARESAARRAAEAAAAAAATPRPSTRTPGAASGPGAGQVISGLICPVPGAAFSDDWGQPRSGGRSHQGTDMFASMGAPNSAVVGGSVSVQSGGAGGNMLYLSGNDGNTYIYMHVSSFAVSSGSVSQGDVVAYLGDTGNAAGTPHTHFEIHPGGGGAINPYPTLASIC